MKKTALVITVLAASFSSISAFAGGSSHIAVGGAGAFYCNYTTGSGLLGSTVDIDTNNVKVKGFCDGSMVAGKGHIRGMPVSDLNDTYFLVKMDGHKKRGTIDVRLNGVGDIECHHGYGNNKKVFRPDAGYC